jgi:hypothetical protein
MWNSSTKLFPVFLVLYVWLFSFNGYAAGDSLKVQKQVVFDSSQVEVRQLSADKQKQLLADSDYKYNRVGPAPKTPWERFVSWLSRKFGELFDSEGGTIGLRILKYVLIIAAIVLIVFLLLKNNVRALFYGKSASVAIDFKEFEEDIHAINFTDLIAIALSEKDYRRAVRLHFLKLLKELTDKNLIAWKIDKTNNDYFMELVNTKYSGHFKELSFLYEHIWYGNFELDESNYKTTIEKFKVVEL